MANKLKIAHKQNGILTDQADGTSGFGGTGGIPKTVTSTGTKTISIQYVTPANVAVSTGYIVTQKGARKFMVANSAAVGTQVATVLLTNNSAANLTPGQGSITCYNTSNVAFYASRITNRFVYDFAGNKYIYKINTAATATYANVASA